MIWDEPWKPGAAPKLKKDEVLEADLSAGDKKWTKADWCVAIGDEFTKKQLIIQDFFGPNFDDQTTVAKVGWLRFMNICIINW